MTSTAPGRRALITGGASGFGLAIARRLVAAGAQVAIADASTTALGQQVLDWKTQSTGRTAEEIQAAAARTDPLGRNATAADVAGAVLWFPSEEATFITGVALDVDGGAHLGFLPGA